MIYFNNKEKDSLNKFLLKQFEEGFEERIAKALYAKDYRKVGMLMKIKEQWNKGGENDLQA